MKDKLRKIKMKKDGSIPKYTTNFTQSWDELRRVNVTIAKEDFVSLALLGVPKSSHNNQNSVYGREKLA